MMEKLRGIVRSPERPVTVEAMNEAIAAAAVAGECPAHLKLDKHRRSLALHQLVAQRLRGNPALLAVARANLTRWMPANRHALPWLEEWQAVIDQGLDATLALMTDPGEHATDMRQSSPFTGILTDDERSEFFAAWRAHHPLAQDMNF